MKKKITDKAYITQWEIFKANIDRTTPVDLSETPVQKQNRKKRLEANPEEWFKYYFATFYTSEPAPFHLRATKRILTNPEWYEVRSWARELSKSGRTMFEVMYLCLTGKKKNVLMVSSTYDNAERLLLPYKSTFESNNRIKNDYGEQESLKNWEAGEFITAKGVAFRALGAGQSPRGTRNEAYRPDVILIDDIDTDEECRNRDRIKVKMKWIEEALIPTRSISGELLIIACGNIIASYCCITEMGKKADKWDIINIRDKHGKSSWAAKNSEADIDRVLSQISYNSAQKEYFNNPIVEGSTFTSLRYGAAPPLRTCEKVVVYADPATSNKAESKSSTKGVGIIGYKNFTYYLYKIYLDHTTNAVFVDWLYDAYRYCKAEGVDTFTEYVENNSLQDPHYEQVLIPLINEKSRVFGFYPPITPDKRKKPEKFSRIEGTLEPLHRMERFIANEKEKGSPYMERFEQQWLNVSPDCKEMDGPDLAEGGVWLIQNQLVRANTRFYSHQRPARKY